MSGPADGVDRADGTGGVDGEEDADRPEDADRGATADDGRAAAAVPDGGPGLEGVARQFAAVRPRMVRIAYAVLGSHSEAEDVVSDCWPRLAAAHAADPVQDVEAWATVAVARMALDALRAARRRRETYVGPWLPEPLITAAGGTAAGFAGAGGAPGSGPPDPADRITLDESVSFALLVVLESLSPAERTAFVLHDLFGVEFAEVAEAVGRTPAAVRQLAARARRHLSARPERFTVRAGEHEAAVSAFVRATAGGDLAALVRVLDPRVTLTSDGAGRLGVARHPVHGADRVARFVLGVAGRVTPVQRLAPIDVNGALGLAVLEGDRMTTAVVLTTAAGRVTRVDLILTPAKLPGPADGPAA